MHCQSPQGLLLLLSRKSEKIGAKINLNPKVEKNGNKESQPDEERQEQRGSGWTGGVGSGASSLSLQQTHSCCGSHRGDHQPSLAKQQEGGTEGEVSKKDE